MLDQHKLEAAGTPTVILVAQKFRPSAEKHARAFGADWLPFAVVPDCFTSIPDETVRSQALGALDAVVEGLTASRHASPPADGLKAAAPATERMSGADRFECFQAMNRAFLDRGWSDGFPLLPPTADVVERLLGGTRLAASDLVGVLPPANGLATVHYIAVNAAMAGCQPEELPVVIAAVKALTTYPFPSRTALVSTGGYGQLYLVNGPIGKRIGLNAGAAALVPGAPSSVNMRLARAMRLVVMNVGHAYPTLLDGSTIGSPRKFNMFVGENVEQSPWQPYHVEGGFGAGDDTVTVFNTLADVDVLDVFNSSAEGIATSLAAYSTFPSGEFLGWEERWGRDTNHSGRVLLLVCPEHAGILAGAGWTRAQLRSYLHQQVRIPARWFKNIHRNHPERNAPDYKWIMNLPDDERIIATESPDMFHVAVVGGSVGRSVSFKCYGQPVTVRVE